MLSHNVSKKSLRWIGLLAVALISTAALGADEPPKPRVVKTPEPVTVTLSITPAAESNPPLKYSLARTYFDRKPGNAATFYYRAIMQILALEKEPDAVMKWRDMPLAELPKDEIRSWLDKHHNVFGELRTATSRETCQWDYRLQDLRGIETVSFLLPEVQTLRRLSNLLRIKARLAIVENDFETALTCLRDGYQLAQDTAEAPFLINALVGAAVVQTMNDTLLELIAAPNSPNLYWAIAALPNTPLNFRRAFESEMNLPFQLFPMLRDTEKSKLTPDEWRKQFLDSSNLLQLIAGGWSETGKKNDSITESLKEFASTTALLGRALLASQTAKEQLLAGGWKAERVAALSPEHAIAIQTEREILYAYHEFFKTLLVPYSVAPDAARDTEQRLRAEGYFDSPVSRRGALPIVAQILPALTAVRDRAAVVERDLAALRVLESLRMHAAQHANQLPQSLADIKCVHVPLNPATGQPFSYQLEKDSATLEVPAVGVIGAKRFVMKVATVKIVTKRGD